MRILEMLMVSLGCAAAFANHADVAGGGTAVASATVTMDWVTVGNAGNAADPSDGDHSTPGFEQFGNVPYEYRIGKYEVTNAQYATFLNAVAASDPNVLYSTFMSSQVRGGIIRSGTAGSYTYTVKTNMGDKPVNYVSWYSAARMANWMTNGQGAGGTESGVYVFSGPTSISAITRDLSNPNQVFIPTENEWYKAAFHQPAISGGDTDNYWLYATRSNVVPTIAAANAIGNVSNPGQSVANYNSGAGWNGPASNVTTVGSAGSSSFYGAFDMNGNVHEWNETLIGSSLRGLRGGTHSEFESALRSSGRGRGDPRFVTVTHDRIGFRLGSPAPGPGCPADLNSDGVVNVTDLTRFLGIFGTSVTPGGAGDLNGDGQVNVADVTLFLGEFGMICA